MVRTGIQTERNLLDVELSQSIDCMTAGSWDAKILLQGFPFSLFSDLKFFNIINN